MHLLGFLSGISVAFYLALGICYSAIVFLSFVSAFIESLFVEFLYPLICDFFGNANGERIKFLFRSLKNPFDYAISTYLVKVLPEKFSVFLEELLFSLDIRPYIYDHFKSQWRAFSKGSFIFIRYTCYIQTRFFLRWVFSWLHYLFWKSENFVPRRRLRRVALRGYYAHMRALIKSKKPRPTAVRYKNWLRPLGSFSKKIYYWHNFFLWLRHCFYYYFFLPYIIILKYRLKRKFLQFSFWLRVHKPSCKKCFTKCAVFF